MPKKSEAIRKLIRELELGKKKLRMEYNQGVRVIDAAITALKKMELEAGNVIKAAHSSAAGRTVKSRASLSKLIGKNAGRRGRPSTMKGGGQPGLTQLIFETVHAKKRFVHQREIVQGIIKKFPDEEPADFARKVSVLLAALKRQKRLVTVNQGDYRRKLYWGLPAWLSADGKMLKANEIKAEKPKKVVKKTGK